MRLALIHPPFDDPTLPYHSTAYLAGHLRHNGFDGVSMRDLNIEFIDYALKEEIVLSLYSEAEARARSLKGRRELDFREQEQLYSLLIADRTSPADLRRACAVLRDENAFLDYDAYGSSVRTVAGYFGFLGALSYPADIISCTQKTRGRYSIFSVADLLNPELGRAVCWPFQSYFEQRLVHDSDIASADIVGISLVYDHQMFYGLHLARMVKARWPEKAVILGGTAITQSYKYMADKSNMKRFFSICDAIVVGEGETAICEIVAAGGFSGDRQFTNTITYDRQRDELHLPSICYENVNALGRPHYDHPWELYLSPARGINYSPTRGCYWNKCTFCDYGLNTDKPTSPWRERTIPNVISDLQAVTREHGVEYVYFAVDVMSPAYLERISDAIVAAGLEIRWGAELRMEKVFNAERCHKLKQAGCTAISFGMESGNQRILDLIDKGTKVEFMRQTMKNVANAGIAVQLMTFVDFPTETPSERQETFNFVKENAEYWSAGGVATFLLTGTSIVAKHPERFGVTLVEPENLDIRRALFYKVNQETGERVALTEDCDASFDNAGEIFPLTFGRPWAGGNDTLHSMIYYDAYDRNFFKTVCARENGQAQPAQVAGPDARLVIHGVLIECPFDLTQIVRNRGLFKDFVGEVIQSAAEPTEARFAEWNRKLAPLPQTPETHQFWLSTGQKTVRLSRGLYQVLGRCKARCLTVEQMCALLPENLREKALGLIRNLQAEGFVSFVQPAQASENLAIDESHISRVPRKLSNRYQYKIAAS